MASRLGSLNVEFIQVFNVMAPHGLAALAASSSGKTASAGGGPSLPELALEKWSAPDMFSAPV